MHAMTSAKVCQISSRAHTTSVFKFVHRSNIDKLQAEIDVDVQQKRVGVEQMIDSDETG
jgi:hypothetical protein